MQLFIKFIILEVIIYNMLISSTRKFQKKEKKRKLFFVSCDSFYVFDTSTLNIKLFDVGFKFR